MGVLNIVLHEPEIPANTGNIGRTCVATGTRLHLIEPLGFRLNEKAIKRAGMDYWEHLDVTDIWTMRIFSKRIREQRFITQPPRHLRLIQMCSMRMTVSLCLARRVRESRRISW